MSEYRNFDLEDVKTFDALSEFYPSHINAMTEEELNCKSDIAWELCFRDSQIKQLEAELEEEREENASLRSGDDYERGAE